MKISRQFPAVAVAAVASAQNSTVGDGSDISNPVVSISSCQALSCNPLNDSICALGETSWPEVGVGIAAGAVEAPSTNLSLTLIDGLGANGFTGYIYEGYDYSDQSLFVGLSPELGEDSFPSGCALMMQYQGQTFPTEWSPASENSREDRFKNTTSCNGVIDILCQSAIVDMIRSFNASEADGGDGGDRCLRLTRHVNMRLQDNHYTCGQSSWIANFMNVTGGPLPGPATSPARNERLGGSDSCRPVLPQQNQLYKVADMRQFYFPDPPEEGREFYSHVFGGRAGYTPVMTVLYGEQNLSHPDVQFSCLKTFERDGGPRADPFTSGSIAGPQGCLSMLVGLPLMTILLAL